MRTTSSKDASVRKVLIRGRQVSLYFYKGYWYTVPTLAKKVGMNSTTLRIRLKNMSVEAAVTKPMAKTHITDNVFSCSRDCLHCEYDDCRYNGPVWPGENKILTELHMV